MIDELLEKYSNSDHYTYNKRTKIVWFATFPNGRRFCIRRCTGKKNTWNSKKQLIAAIREMARSMYHDRTIYGQLVESHSPTMDYVVFMDEVVGKMNIESAEV